MSFNSEQKTVSSKLLSQVIYKVPRNQRKYVWQLNNWSELWNDIVFTKDDELSSHFIGSVVLMDKAEKDGIQNYDIIDGQQRIISLLLFVSAIMQIYKERGETDLYNGLNRFLLSTDLRSQKLCKIQSEYQPSIESIISRVTEDGPTFATILEDLSDVDDKSIVDCFAFFYGKLNELETETILQIQLAILRTNYIDITATTEEDSYTIFEILNARGMVLEDTELLKNYIMRYTRPITDIDRIKTDWESNLVSVLGDGFNKFLLHYVRHKYKTPNNKVSPYSVIKANNTSATIATLFADLKKKAKYYNKLHSPIKVSDGGSCSSLEYRVFKFFKAYRGELFRPLLLSLIHQKEQGALSVATYEKVLNYLQYFFTCYNLISQETSNKISNLVLKYAYTIENEYNLNVVKDLISDLTEKLPPKTIFQKSFSTLGWSHETPYYADSTHKKKVQIALSTIEYIKTGLSTIDDFTIEHISPDSTSADNALIGNLLPLEESLNNNCKDKPVLEKLPSYRSSNFKSARDFAERNPDGTFDAKNRAKIMASIIYDELKNASRAIR